MVSEKAMTSDFYLSDDTEMTPELLHEYIEYHKARVKHYKQLKNAYECKYDIFSDKKKEAYKPDNRIAVNFAKYIVDTMLGYFIGVPLKITHSDKQVSEYLNFFDAYNNQDDKNAELSKICDIYGHGYELLFNDENSEVGTVNLTPLECFIIYDDSLLHRPLFGVRYYYDNDGIMCGSFSTSEYIQYFKNDGGIKFIDEPENHPFGEVPIIEYTENAEKHGIFEDVMSLINAYNKAISEKANDVDYYADAYLKILGAVLDEKSLKNLRDSRIINLEGQDAEKIIVEFLQKPDSDGTQENLINRLEKLIFQISMVANISDENFGTSSGIALKYKLQSMSNLAKTKERKFRAGLNRRYKMLCNYPGNKLKTDDYLGIDIKFTPNIPNNLLEESQIAGNLAGITSEETQLSVLSCVDDVDSEVKKKKEEKTITDYPTNRTMTDEKSNVLEQQAETTEQSA